MSNLNQTQLLRESLRILVRKLGILERGGGFVLWNNVESELYHS